MYPPAKNTGHGKDGKLLRAARLTVPLMLPGAILKEARSWDPMVKTQVDEDNLKHMGVSQEELEGLQESPQRGTRIIGKPVFSCAGTGWEGVATGSGGVRGHAPSGKNIHFTGATSSFRQDSTTFLRR